ncbi:MAG: hypothetical protein RI885_897 [Actinomycetota bacterium]
MTGAWQGVATTLVDQRGAALTRYAWLLTGDADDAADLVQDALVKTFGRVRTTFTVGSAEAYVRRTMLNTFLDAGRRRTRWRRVAHLQLVPDASDSSASGTELKLDLRRELDRLTPRERACLLLRYYDDLLVDDIAAALGISSGTVKRYLSDGLAKMAVALDPQVDTAASPDRPAPAGRPAPPDRPATADRSATGHLTPDSASTDLPGTTTATSAPRGAHNV